MENEPKIDIEHVVSELSSISFDYLNFVITLEWYGTLTDVEICDNLRSDNVHVDSED